MMAGLLMSFSDRFNAQFVDPAPIQNAEYFYAYAPNILGYEKVLLKKNDGQYLVFHLTEVKGMHFLTADTLSPTDTIEYWEGKNYFRYLGSEFTMGNCEQKACLLRHSKTSFEAIRIHESGITNRECFARQFSLLDSINQSCPKLKFQNRKALKEYLGNRPADKDPSMCVAVYDDSFHGFDLHFGLGRKLDSISKGCD